MQMKNKKSKRSLIDQAIKLSDGNKNASFKQAKKWCKESILLEAQQGNFECKISRSSHDFSGWLVGNLKKEDVEKLKDYFVDNGFNVSSTDEDILISWNKKNESKKQNTSAKSPSIKK
jgi:hypothetical protein